MKKHIDMTADQLVQVCNGIKNGITEEAKINYDQIQEITADFSEVNSEYDLRLELEPLTECGYSAEDVADILGELEFVKVFYNLISDGSGYLYYPCGSNALSNYLSYGDPLRNVFSNSATSDLLERITSWDDLEGYITDHINQYNAQIARAS